MGGRVRFCDKPKVVVFEEGYAKWTCDKDGTMIPMRLHRSMTYRKIIVWKFYNDFLRMVSLNDPWGLGMVEFSTELHNTISVITRRVNIDEFLVNSNNLFEYFFSESVDESELVDSVFGILQKQTLFLFHEQNILREEMNTFQYTLHSHLYDYTKFYVSDSPTCSEIYDLLTRRYKMYLVHPDILY